MEWLTLFHAAVLFLYPLKDQKTPGIQGAKKKIGCTKV